MCMKDSLKSLQNHHPSQIPSITTVLYLKIVIGFIGIILLLCWDKFWNIKRKDCINNNLVSDNL